MTRWVEQRAVCVPETPRILTKARSPPSALSTAQDVHLLTSTPQKRRTIRDRSKTDGEGYTLCWGCPRQTSTAEEQAAGASCCADVVSVVAKKGGNWIGERERSTGICQWGEICVGVVSSAEEGVVLMERRSKYLLTQAASVSAKDFTAPS
jgi:hypothetical protein